MKIIALMPVRNEAWVLPHSLACLSAFCDVVLVNDQNSEDESREICRTFPKVVLLESSERLICEEARWQLLDRTPRGRFKSATEAGASGDWPRRHDQYDDDERSQ